MDRALELARGVLGGVSPNPAVGCVILKDGVVVGEGANEAPGGPHAEVIALRQAGERARGGVMYVSLEPCSHYGRTPPCADAVAEAGLAAVHAAVRDPNPLVAGHGIERLRAAGIEVIEGEREDEARRVNEAFMKWVTTDLPFVYVKFAMSLDGKIATAAGDSRWISGERARAEVHRLRGLVDAVMVGANTARLDDPRLTARDGSDGEKTSARQPLRVVVDAKASLSPQARMLGEPGRTLVAATDGASEAARRALTEAGAEIETVEAAPGGGVNPEALLRCLGEREVTSLLVEGGGRLIGSLLDARLVDKVIAFVAPVLVGGADAPTPAAGRGVERIADALRLRDVETAVLDGDVMITGYAGVGPTA